MENATLIKRRGRYLWCLYGLAAIAGVRAALLPPERSYSGLLLSLATGLLLALLVSLDARIVGKPWPQSAGWLVLFFWPVAAPACIIALRRWAGLAIVLGHSTLLCILAGIVAVGVRWLAT